MTDWTTMIDAMGIYADNIPAVTGKVAGYVTGSNGILWNASDWSRFPDAGKVRIDQAPGLPEYRAGRADVADIESGAATVAEYAVAALERTALKLTHHVYGSYSTLEAVAAAQAPVTDCWLADPSLSQNEAIGLLGTRYRGLMIAAVQWAWPSTNPDSTCPGSVLPLSRLNVDLSVTLATWFPAPVEVPVECVITWAGSDGLVARKTSVPRVMWDQLKFEQAN